jgi:hypothetical protein
MAWQLTHLYIPAPYNRPGMPAQVKETVLSQLYGPDGVEHALAAGWLQEVRRHPQGYRRFAIQLTDRRSYHPIPVNFLLTWQGDVLC